MQLIYFEWIFFIVCLFINIYWISVEDASYKEVQKLGNFYTYFLPPVWKKIDSSNELVTGIHLSYEVALTFSFFFQTTECVYNYIHYIT